MTTSTNSSILNTSAALRVLGGLETKSDFRGAYMAARDEDTWKATLAGSNITSLPTFNNPVKPSLELLRLEDELTATVEKIAELKKFRSIIVASYNYSKATLFFSISSAIKALNRDVKLLRECIEVEKEYKQQAFVKKSFNKLHGSYAPAAAKVDEKAVKKMINRMNFEELNGYQHKSNPYYDIEKWQLIKVTGYEYRKPYIIISAVKVEDEHDRLTNTRQMDETSEFYFTFDITPQFDKNGKVVDNFELVNLRQWMWNKVDHSQDGCTMGAMLQELIGRVACISSDMLTWKKDENGNIILDENGNPKMFHNPDFIGFPTYNIEERIGSTFNRDDRDYCGTHTNIHISNRDIEEINGDIRFETTSTHVNIFSGNKLLRSYHIFGADEA